MPRPRHHDRDRSRHTALTRGDDAALCTDLYQLTMSQAYVARDMHEDATFSLFVRSLPRQRNYLVACGVEAALDFLETVRFSPGDLDYLRSLERFSPQFLDYLERFRFEGDVWAVPEGTPVFPEEPIVEVDGPIAQAQIVEAIVMNYVHSQTVLATKASRIATAARGRDVLDFGLRRTHGVDGATRAARAYYIAGLAATSNMLAGKELGVPVAGTMAHSYIQAHDDELDALRGFVREFPDTILLVDTYDTLDGVRLVVDLARELGDEFRVSGVRLDSGDLGALAVDARGILDDAGLGHLRIVASGGLDEYAIHELLARGAPIDGFGVGTALGTASDAPALDMAYKLTEYAGEGRMKLSSGKRTLPGRKQIFRRERDGRATGDVIARRDEELSGRPLLHRVMRRGARARPTPPLDEVRAYARRELDALPDRVRALEPAEPGYDVALSEALREHTEAVRRRVSRRGTRLSG